MADIDIIREKIDVLDGSRSRFKEKAAVRLQDLNGLLQLPPTLQSKQLAAAPTQADFNALQKDMATVQHQLTIVAEALQKRLAP